MFGAFVAGSIASKLTLDKTQWNSSVQSVGADQKKMQGMSAKTADGFKKAGKAMTIAGAAIVATMGLMVKKYVKAGDEVHKMSLRTGFATKTLSELSYAAEISGADIGVLEKGVKKMSKTIVDANDGMTTYQRAFDRIGVSYKDLIDLSPEQQFEKLAVAIAGVENPTVRAAAAQDIFGRAGTQLLPLFNEGVEGMEALRAKAHDLGIVFDQEAANKAARLADAQTTLKTAMSGLSITIADNIVPVLSKLVEGLSNIVAKFTEWSKAHPGLSSALTKIVAVLGALLTVLGPIAIILPKIAKGFGMMGGAIKKVIPSVATLKGKVGVGGLHGLLGKLPAVGMAAFAGWKIGRLIGETTGLDEKIQNLTASLLGLGDISNYEVTPSLGKEADALEKLKEITKTTGWTVWDLKQKYGSYSEALKAVKKGEEEAGGTSKKLGENYEKTGTVVDELKEKTKTYIDYLGDLGIQTIKEKQDRVRELEGYLGDLDQAYQTGKISLEDYTTATNAAKTEIKELSEAMIQTAIPATRNMAGVLDQAVTQMDGRINVLPDAVKTVATKISGHWLRLTSGMGDAFGDATEDLLTKGSDLGDGLDILWKGIGSSFKGMLGNMVREWTTKFLRSLVTKSAEAASSVATSTATAAKGAVGVASSIASGIVTLAQGIASAAGIIAKAAPQILIAAGVALAISAGFKAIGALFKGGKKYEEMTYWLKMIKDNSQILVNWTQDAIVPLMDYFAKMLEEISGKLSDPKTQQEMGNTTTLLDGILEKMDAFGTQLFDKLDTFGKHFEGILTRVTSIAARIVYTNRILRRIEGKVEGGGRRRRRRGEEPYDAPLTPEGPGSRDLIAGGLAPALASTIDRPDEPGTIRTTREERIWGRMEARHLARLEARFERRMGRGEIREQPIGPRTPDLATMMAASPTNITLNFQFDNQVDPNFTRDYVRREIVPQILDSLEVKHKKRRWKKGLGI